ncbi:MAG: hypothetical protein IJ621_05510 [Paludibacteraceae bacterium]|nr:hypothetical protein [Paludibacteraceae bacterium]
MKINYFLLGCTALLFLSCGSRHYAKGSFTLRCAEELLEYVTPEMTYISPKGDTTFVLLTKDKWKKKYSFTADGSQTEDKAYREYVIGFKERLRAFETRAIVNYRLKDNVDLADKDINTYHKLSGSCKIVNDVWNDAVTISQNVNAEINIVIDDSTKQNLEKYLNNLCNSPEIYAIRVNENGEIDTTHN